MALLPVIGPHWTVCTGAGCGALHSLTTQPGSCSFCSLTTLDAPGLSPHPVLGAFRPGEKEGWCGAFLRGTKQFLQHRLPGEPGKYRLPSKKDPGCTVMGAHGLYHTDFPLWSDSRTPHQVLSSFV